MSTEIFIQVELYETIKKKYGVPQKGDILLTSVGTLGIPNLVDNEPFYFKDGNLTWFSNFKDALSEYIYMWLCTPMAKYQIDAKCIGSTQKALTIETLRKFTLPLPTIDVQKRICSIYFSLSEKIQQNNRINKNLEEMAQAIFKSWFVDFEPFQDGEFVESKLGLIPKGWKVVSIGSICDVKGGKRLPKGKNLIQIANKHPYIRVRDLNNTLFANLDKEYGYVDDETQKSIARYIIFTNDVLISIVGTIGLIVKVHPSLNKANLTENCVKLTNLKIVTPDYLFLFLLSNAGQESLKKGTVGAVQAKLPIKNIQSLPLLLPPDSVINEFQSIVGDMLTLVSNNLTENCSLNEVRDTLLPKLMSGEIDVSKVII